MSKDNIKNRGFASMSKEQQEEARRKSAQTRAANKLKKEKQLAEAKKLRKKAEDLQKEVEMLLQQADELDGQCSSEKIRKKREAEISDRIDELYKDTVNPQYLKIMKKYAILRGEDPEDLVTPTFAAMDILHDPRATAKERDNAIKTLQQYENAKPAQIAEAGDVILSGEEELQSLLSTVAEAAPKGW